MPPSQPHRDSKREDEHDDRAYPSLHKARVRLASSLLFPPPLSLASSFKNAPFGTLRSLLTALSNRSNSVLPGTFGAVSGFIPDHGNAICGQESRSSYRVPTERDAADWA